MLQRLCVAGWSLITVQLYTPCLGLNRNPFGLRQAFQTDETGKTAGSIAALFHLAAIRVEYAVAELGVVLLGCFNQQQLVTSDTMAPIGDMANLWRGQIDLLSDRIDHNKVIAQAVHFAER